MRNIYFLIILLGMTFAVIPLTDSALAGEKQVEGSSNALIVGTELDYPPYSFLDEEGKPSGFNVALTQAIAKAMGLNIEVRIGPWADIRKGLREGKIDVISGMYYSKERAKTVDFSPPYTIVNHAIFARRDSPRIKSATDLRGRKIIVMRGDIMHDYVLKEGLSQNPGLADTQSEALRLLSSGKYDFALIAKLPGLYWVKKLGLSNIVTVGPLIRPSAYCYAVEKGNSELLSRFSEGLAIIKKTGRMKEIYDVWLGVLEPQGVPKAVILKYVGLALLVFLLILAGGVVWVRTLRSQVAQRTKELEHQITDRKRAEETLKDSEAFLKTLIDAIPTPVFYKDRDGKYLGFNRSFETFFGETKEGLIGKSVFDIHPPELAEIYHAQDEKLLHGGGEQRYESQWKNAHGELRDIIFNKAVFTNSKGTVAGLIGAIMDITERKQTEEALRESEKEFSTLFHASPVYIAFTALDDGYFLDVNDAFTKITGYQRNEVLGRTSVEIGLWVDPEERAKFIELARRHGGFHEEEVRFRKKNGDLLFGIWSAEKIEMGGKASLISVLVDITERREAQEALRQERDKLRAAISEIKTLSGLVPICSHCKKIRDDKGYWNQIEKYIGERSDAQFSHGICPECAKKLYPDFDLYDDEGNLT